MRMMSEVTLFARLLGDALQRLNAPVRRLHRGVSAEYRGRATVERGKGILVNRFCDWGHLPRSVSDSPLRFRLEVNGESETWTRFFSGSGPMVSQVEASGGLLRERLGPAQLDFELSERQGVLHWRAVKLHVWRIPVPCSAFNFNARVSGEGTQYRFEIEAHLALVGLLVRYQGVLDVD
jgi:hypothetical protein